MDLRPFTFQEFYRLEDATASFIEVFEEKTGSLLYDYFMGCLYVTPLIVHTENT